jgi:hypothetical protein
MLGNGLPVGPEREAEVQTRSDATPAASIHYHCWTEFEMLELIDYVRKNFCVPCEMLHFSKRHKECLLVLKKIPRGIKNESGG